MAFWARRNKAEETNNLSGSAEEMTRRSAAQPHTRSEPERFAKQDRDIRLAEFLARQEKQRQEREAQRAEREAQQEKQRQERQAWLAGMEAQQEKQRNEQEADHAELLLQQEKNRQDMKSATAAVRDWFTALVAAREPGERALSDDLLRKVGGPSLPSGYPGPGRIMQYAAAAYGSEMAKRMAERAHIDALKSDDFETEQEHRALSDFWVSLVPLAERL